MVESKQQGWRDLVTILLALAFFAQSYLIQSHIHTAFGQGQALAWSNIAGAGDSPADCPICQADILSGAYVVPTAPQVPSMLVHALAKHWFADNSLQLSPHRHSWQGRAPPLP